MELHEFFNQDQINWLKQKVLTEKITAIKAIAATGCGLSEAHKVANQLQKEAKAEMKSTNTEMLEEWARERFWN